MTNNRYIIYMILHYSYIFVGAYLAELLYRKYVKKNDTYDQISIGVVLGLISIFTIVSVRLLDIMSMPDGRFIIPFIAIVFYSPIAAIVSAITVFIVSIIGGYPNNFILSINILLFLLFGYFSEKLHKKYKWDQVRLNGIMAVLALTFVIVAVALSSVGTIPKQYFYHNLISNYLVLVVLVTVISFSIEHSREILYKINILQGTKEELQILNDELVASKEQYQLVISASQEGFIDYIPRENRVEISEQCLNLLQYDLEDMAYVKGELRKLRLGKPNNLVYEKDIDTTRDVIEEFISETFEDKELVARVRCKDGTIKWMFFKVIRVMNKDQAPRIVSSMSDINDKYVKEREIKRLAYYDFHIGIRNKEAFLSTDLSEYSRVAYFEIEHFQLLIDSFGSELKGIMKKNLYKHINSGCEYIEEIFYTGNGSYIMLYNKKGLYEDIIECLRKVSDKNELMIDYNNLNLAFKYRTVIVSRVNEYTDNQSIIYNAKVGIEYAIKNKKQDLIIYGEEIENYQESIYQIRNQLFDANMLNELRAVFQPHHESLNSEPVGFEALIRWNNKKLGEVRPDIFIPIAEKFGVINDIDYFAWGKSFKFIKAYNEKYKKNCYISINVSAMDLLDPKMAEKFIELYEIYDIAIESVRLEITETSIMDYAGVVLNNIDSLIQKGFVFYLDDFGTGYSSLNQLIELKVKAVKIDKDFVNRFFKSKEVASVIKSIIELAHDLDMRVIAEGIETIEQYEALEKLGCNCFQGYYFSKPLEVEELL